MLILGNSSAFAPDLFAGATGSAPTPTPSIPTTLGSRIDNKATVVGVLQDHEGNDYVLAVVDAAYRAGSGMKWSEYTSDSVLQNNDDSTEALEDNHSGKYNTDLILSTYTPTDYPAFNFARNACTVTINGTTYYSVLPNLIELQLLYNNKNVLDQYDPTVSEYSSRSMSEFKFGANGSWSSTEKDSERSWSIFYDGDAGDGYKPVDLGYGVCPVICIPLS